ncbi:cytochrome P450 [Streptomyces sp. NRRL F-525]|uniref:cytochrome P450 n=1 Tax=Streptomyces sp. NRRL F-525 TaxID=1463861 RepID=UPI000691CB25|nr:cytochrome P450 [Streptomyces sp. NRRL F-525]
MDPETLLFSMFTPEGRVNPYPALAELRRTEPIYYHPGFNTYFLTRFADCQAVLTDPAFLVPDLDWCARELPDWRDRPSAEFFYSSLLRSNGTDHARLRRLVGGAFSARRVAALRHTVRDITARLLDDFADATSDGGSADFQELVGYPLPVTVVGHLIGVPVEEQRQFHGLGQDAGRLLEPVRSPEDWRRADLAVVALRAYFTGLIALRRARPADDLTSLLLAVRDTDDGRLTEAELVDILVLVLIAGFETTAGLLGLAVHALLAHRDQWDLLVSGPELAARAVEESLRWDTPVQMTERIAAGPVDVAGVTVPEGANVTTVLAAANRDPERHADPDTFDIRRADIKVLGFSAGLHYCLGAALARVEAAELLEQLPRRFPTLTASAPPHRRESISLRSFENLPLTTKP